MIKLEDKMKKNILKVFNIFFIIIFACVTLSSCVGQKRASFTKAKAKEGKISQSVSSYSASNLDLLASSNFVELYFDRVSFCPVIKDKTTGELWSALTNENFDANTIEMKVEYKGKVYELFSQKNSVALGKASYNYKDTGVEVKYNFEIGENSEKVSFPIFVDFNLKDGCLYVSSNLEKIAKVKGLKILSIDLLPFFGAVKTVSENDFMLVPDGCGAVIKTAAAGNASYNIKTYGYDPALSEKSDIPYSIIPAFGVKHNKDAFSALVIDGDAISRIIANKRQGGYNNVYARFDITQNDLNKDYNGHIAKNPYKGKIQVGYRFFSGNQTTPGGIASLVSEQLIRENFLSDLEDKDNRDIPMNIALLGRMKKGHVMKNLTDFDEAIEILTYAKTKDINNINLRYLGALSGGEKQKSLNFAKLSKSLGTKSSFRELNDYVKTQECNLFIDTKLHKSCKRKVFDIKGRMINYTGPNGEKVYPSSLRKGENYVIPFLRNMKKREITGYCVSDASKVLYSDFYNSRMNRQETSTIVKNQIKLLSNSRDTAVEHGNAYSLFETDVVYNLPYKNTYKNNEFYNAVPFVQMILHGNMDYSFGYFNLDANPKILMLKSIEYGAVPSYMWSFSDNNNKTFYEDNMKQASSDYKAFKDAFKDLRYTKIKNNTKVADGLYMTEYNNGTHIYVNYNNKDVTYNSFTIKAQSYLRVN